MKKRIFFTVALLVVFFIIGRGVFNSLASNNNTQYQFSEIIRGNLESTISCSGTLSPVTAVEIGTQVSGTIAKVYVDYNDQVRKGQLLAVLDTVLLKASVLDAQAGVEKAEAQLQDAQVNYQRNQKLFEKGLISEAEFQPFQINLKTQQANLKSAQAALQRAEQNLKYAVIRSPINGTVIERNVEAGQTVAASLSTPTLFKIAEDLSKMEILVEVDESDIGLIKDGQSVRFDVQAYSDKIFAGTVRQIRLQPTTVSNVVNYTVVVDADNHENLLLPGMTATVDFIIEQKQDVLLVPNSALRFQPSDEQLTEIREKRQRGFEALPDSIKGQRRKQMGKPANGVSNGARSDDRKQVWYLDEHGQLAMEPVRIGMTDGSKSEIMMSRHLEDGMQVINGTSQNNKQNNSGSANKALARPPGGPRPF